MRPGRRPAKLDDAPRRDLLVPDLAARLDAAAAKAALTRVEIARALDVHPRTVARWLQRNANPRPEALKRISELVTVLERLSFVLRPQPAHDWLFAPNPLMDHCKPVDILRAGEPGHVLGAIGSLAENVSV